MALLEKLTDAGRWPAETEPGLKQRFGSAIEDGVRPAALLISFLLLAVSFSVASAAEAREAGSGAKAQLAGQLLPIRGGNDEAIDSARQADLTISRAERVLVQVYVSGPAEAAVERLRKAGMSVKATADEPVPAVEGWVEANALTSVARLGFTDAVLPVMAGGSDAGSVQSEGVAAHRIPQAIGSGAVDGDGVDVGVISTSIDQLGGGISDSQATGDLPPTVTVLKDDPGADDDEGRAMAEIIFDGAPGIDRILYASGTAAGPLDKADSIDQLVAGGAEVIADDIFWLNEPFFQDGAISQAVDRARAAGVTYVASAGNRARQSWEGTYDASTGSSGIHDFNPGASPVEDPTPEVQTLATIANGGFIQLVAQWGEPWGGAETDLDFKLVTPDGDPLPCFVAADQPGANPSGGLDNNPSSGLPLEIFSWQNNCNAGDVEVALSIERFSGTNSPFIKYIARGSFGSFNPEYGTNSNTINPDAASAEGALTVAAVDATDPGLDSPQPYSSRGPNTRLFDKDGARLPGPQVRLKPELAAADGLSTTVPGFGAPGDPFAFFGTSAAVPSAAGIAAVLRSSNLAANADEIERVMTTPANAIDCIESPLVPDPDCGAGFLLADRAFSGLDLATPDTIINSGPSGTITTDQATFTFAGSPAADTAKVQCRIDSGPFTDCTSPKTFTGLSDGPHTAEFRAEDAAGNRDATPATRTFTVDTAIPEARISKVRVSGPGKVRKGKKATYRVKTTNAGSIGATGVRLRVSGRGVSLRTSVGKIAAKKTRTVRIKLKPRKTGRVKVSFKVTSRNAGGKSTRKTIRVRKRR